MKDKSVTSTETKIDLPPKKDVEAWADAAFLRLWYHWETGLNMEHDRDHWLYDDFWKAGNTLDAAINYYVVRKPDTTKENFPKIADIVQKSYDSIFRDFVPYPKGKWRDDYGWWGNAFVNAYKNADTLGLDHTLKDTCMIAAYCWQVLYESACDSEKDDDPDHKYLGAGYAAWNEGGLVQYLKNPAEYKQTPNSVTNLGFWALSLGIYEHMSRDRKYLDAARAICDWFYSFYDYGDYGTFALFNEYQLINETVNPVAHPAWCIPDPPRPSGRGSDRAWSADQGVFLYCLWKTLQYEDSPGRRDKLRRLIDTLYQAFMTNSVMIGSDDIFREYDHDPEVGGNASNFNDNYATGPGVFMRYVGYSLPMMTGDDDEPIKSLFTKCMAASARSAWNCRDTGIETNQIFAWDVPANNLDETKYWRYYNAMQDTDLFQLTFQAGALDLFVALLRLCQ